ncbi:MAG: glycosyltransferase family 61 protein [Pseudomonadota bacterium]
MSAPHTSPLDPPLHDDALHAAARALIAPGDAVLETGPAMDPLSPRMAADSAATWRLHSPTWAAPTPSNLTVDTGKTPLAALIATRPPDVLILHVGPAEAAALHTTELAGIERCLINFRTPGCTIALMRAAKSRLKALGFAKQGPHSSRWLWVCSRRTAQTDAATRPSHKGGWSEQIEMHANAVVQPSVGRSLSAPRGVQTASGADVPLSGHWRHNRRMTLPFSPPPACVDLPGRHLWGGIIYRTFSHFIAESLGRLWALEATPDPIDGVVFVKIGEQQDATLTAFQRDMFALIGVRCPVHVIETPTRVAELVVPGQGFGLGSIVEGTARFKDHLDRHFAKDIAPDGPERLYISRSQLGLGRGSLLGETVIEDHLRAEGYEIFYPEQHDIPTQIARYKAARQVVACDGSALHVLALCRNKSQQVAMICRRKSMETRQIARNIKGFTGRAPVVIHCLDREWQRASGSRRKGLVMGEPNLPTLHAHLSQAGLITGKTPWPALETDALSAALGADWAPI